MLIVAERINASRKAIRAALEQMDAAAIQHEARAQDAAGATYIDVNGGTFPGREPELLAWLVETVQAVTARPLCLDSSDPEAIATALPRARAKPPMINSINLERERYARILPLALEHKAKLIALCQGEGALPATAAHKIDLASALIDGLTQAGVAILDPTDRELSSAMAAARAVYGRDDYCMDLIEAFRDGAIAA